MKSVLLLTCTEDAHADVLEKMIIQRGHNAWRINFDDLKSTQRLSFALNDAAKISVASSRDVDIKEITGVFVHNPVTKFTRENFPDSTDYDLGFANANWMNYIFWLEETIPNAVWMNHSLGIRRFETIGTQLRLAHSLGFKIPETLFTNDVKELTDFYKSNKKTILKAGYTPGLFRRNLLSLTTFVDINELNGDSLKNSPCLFQEYIEKEYELRIYVVGDRVLACRIDSQAHQSTSLDWRSYGADIPYKIVDLDATTEKQCKDFVKLAGLTFGAFDIVVTPEGENVFLECNTQAAWLWIEDKTGLPITSSVADVLLGE